MKVLVPIDGSDNSMKAVEYAIQMARKDPEVQVTIATVLYPFTPAQAGSGFVFNEVYYEQVAKQCQQDLQRAKELFDAAGLTAGTQLLEGDPANAIVEYVKENGMEEIVMGSRGMGALKSMVLGSVSYKVLARVQVPVTIVK